MGAGSPERGRVPGWDDSIPGASCFASEIAPIRKGAELMKRIVIDIDEDDDS